MLITDSFVIINYPKTGTTFVRKVLHEMHAARMKRNNGDDRASLKELMLPKLYGNYDPSYQDQHGVYRQIPPEHRNKPVISIVRNPLYRYVSSYHFGWWKQHPTLPPNQLRHLIPSFPDLSFDAYYDYLHLPELNETHLFNPAIECYGSYTRMFLFFYASDPEKASAQMANGKRLEALLPPITFLRQETLRNDLYTCLQGFGYSSNELQLISSIKDQNVSQNNDSSTIKPNELAKVAKKVLCRDSPLLDMFPDYKRDIRATITAGEG